MFFVCLTVHIRTKLSHTGQKFSEKNFAKGYVQLLFYNITLIVHEQNFYQYATVYLVRIWTYKNAGEKAHTFSQRSKNVKKKTKQNGYCVNLPSVDPKKLCGRCLTYFLIRISSIARGGGNSSSIGLSTKMQNKKNATSSTSETFFCTGMN